MFQKLNKFVMGIFKRNYRYKHCYVQDLPAKLVPKMVYLQTHLNVPWQAVFLCPCGCKEVVQLNLVLKYRPAWSVKPDKKGISLSPSVRRTAGCYSHFFLRKGQIEWCFDNA
jgi:hypothetical protein